MSATRTDFPPVSWCQGIVNDAQGVCLPRRFTGKWVHRSKLYLLLPFYSSFYSGYGYGSSLGRAWWITINHPSQLSKEKFDIL